MSELLLAAAPPGLLPIRILACVALVSVIAAFPSKFLARRATLFHD
jgi:hypothetical protein